MLQPISFEKFMICAHGLWANQWLLLACGDFEEGRFNAMTVAWGSLGCMWDKPFVQVVVRPSRYTFEFMERYETFTLCAFPEQYRNALQMIGSKSGRHTDKIKEAGLTPIRSTRVKAPSFAEAELAIECRKMYWDDMDSDHFLYPRTHELYPAKDFHRIYFGEVVTLSGNEKFKIG